LSVGFANCPLVIIIGEIFKHYQLTRVNTSAYHSVAQDPISNSKKLQMIFKHLRMSVIMDREVIAAKAFIVDKEGKLLLVKRRADDVQKPGVWEVPGGRLEPGEDILQGLRREILEETGLRVRIQMPMGMHEFTSDDGVRIQMLVFLARQDGGIFALSDEHTKSRWTEFHEAREIIYPAFRQYLDFLEGIEGKE
jgi:8-oxo-dGTP diphosphatase